MFFDDKAKAVGGILALQHKPAEGPEPEPEEHADPLHAIAEELMEAIHAKDVQAVMEALHAFMLEASQPPMG